MLLSTAAVAQHAPPASIDDVLIATKACIAATDASGIHADRITALGFSEARNPRAGERWFVKPPNWALITVEGQPTANVCGVSAGLVPRTTLPHVIAALQSLLGAPRDRTNESTRWVEKEQTILVLSRISSGGGPAVRVDVRPLSQEKQ